MSFDRDTGEEILTRVKRELTDSRESLRDEYKRMGEEVEFALELKQYREQKNQNRGEAKDIWPTDQGIFRFWRFKKAKSSLNFPIHITCEPRDDQGDPSQAVFVKRYLENEVSHQKWKMYADVRDRWIGAALAMRMGVYRWDFVHNLGEAGEIVARLLDSRAVSWNRGHLHPHDPLCPAFFEKFRMPVAEAKRSKGWRASGLEPDDGGGDMFGPGPNVGRNVPLGVDGDHPGYSSDLVGDIDYFTGVMAWYRFENSEELKPRPLEPAERYMICTECPHKTPPQADSGAADIGFEYPEQLDGGCPKCGGMMVRRDAEPYPKSALALAKGKRLVIASLNNSLSAPIYDGAWPCPKARTFPYAFLTTYKFPHKRIPESDISLNWTNSVGINFTKAVIYRQAHRARGIWLLPDVGLKDRNGFRYDLGDDQDDVAFFDTRRPNSKIDNVRPPDISGALFQLHELLQGAFRENEGSSDIFMPKEATRDIPVGTIQRLIETGDVPIDEFGKYIYDAESLSFGVLADYIQWFMTEDKAVKYYNEQGRVMFQKMRGGSLPDVDVIVSAGATMSQVRKEAVEAYQQLMQLPGPRRRRVGQMMGIDPSVLNDMDKDDFATVDWQMKLDQHAQGVVGAASGGAGAGGGGMPPALMQRMMAMAGQGGAAQPTPPNAEMNGA